MGIQFGGIGFNQNSGSGRYLVGAMHMQVQPDIQLYWCISVFPMYTKNIAGVWGLDLGALGWIKFHIWPDI